MSDLTKPENYEKYKQQNAEMLEGVRFEEGDFTALPADESRFIDAMGQRLNSAVMAHAASPVLYKRVSCHLNSGCGLRRQAALFR